MIRFLPLVLLAVGAASAQTVTPVFDEDDAEGDGYYAASDGGPVGNATLVLAGPDGRKLPVASGAAASGADYGVLRYANGDGGGWAIAVGAPGFPTLDLGAPDSVVVFLNGPAGVPGVALPRIALVDADGNRTASVSLDFGGLVGLNQQGSGFLAGSSTNLSVALSYIDSLPADLARPGYPESIRLTFFDEAVSTSRPSIGIPGIPANFTVETEAGLALEFQFTDTDGDGTLSRAGESIVILTEDPATGRLQQTWRIRATATASDPPAAGDVYRLAVFNSGTDDDPATWDRRAVSLDAFGPLDAFDPSVFAGVVFENPEAGSIERTLWIDALAVLAYEGDPDGPAPPSAITTQVGRETVALRWTPTPGADGVVIFRQRPGELYQRITPSIVRTDHFFDLGARNGERASYILRSVDNNGLREPLQGPDSLPIEATADASLPDPYIEETARRAFDFFWREANPANGLVKDRSTPGSASSIASVGFGLSAYTVAADRGWITREQAVGRTLATLEFFASCPQSDAAGGACGYKGFFYHFLTMGAGERAGTNELSTIDTALLLGGILHAAQYYDGAGDEEARIRELADRIWRRVDWQWAANRDPLVTLGWSPEEGFAICGGNLCDWNGYNEAMLLYILGLGSPTFPLADDAWEAWTTGYAGQWQTHYGYTFLTFPPLFGHQYSHVWVDFRNTQDAYMRGRGSTYFENSRLATLASRAYAVANPGRFPNYSAQEWGLTASDQPPTLACGSRPNSGYCAHGAPPAQSDNGTITPTAAGGSYAFTPEESREALRTMYARYYARLWGPYGLRDAYNIQENWFATDYLGIDQGPILLMIENERSAALWDAFMTHPDVRRGMARAGFDLPPVAEEDAPAAEAATLGLPSPNPASGAVRLAVTLAEAGPVRLAVFDALGREVAVLLDATRPAGTVFAELDASRLAAGVYVARLEAAGLVRTRTVVVTR